MVSCGIGRNGVLLTSNKSNLLSQFYKKLGNLFVKIPKKPQNSFLIIIDFVTLSEVMMYNTKPYDNSYCEESITNSNNK